MTGPFGMGVLRPQNSTPFWRRYCAGVASSISLTGSRVDSLADAQAVGPTLGRDGANASDDPLYGALIANENPGIRFDDTTATALNGDYLYLAADTTNMHARAVATGVTVYIAFVGHAHASIQQLCGAWKTDSSSAALFQLYLDTSGRVAFRWRNDAGTSIAACNTTASFTDDTWHIARLTVSGGNVSLEVDGANRVTTTYATSGVFTIGREGIGSRFISSAGDSAIEPLDGCVAEWLIYNSDHDGQAIASTVLSYLAATYTTPPAGNVVIADAGAFTPQSGNIDLTMPGSVRAGDIAVFVITRSNGNTVTAPSGVTIRQTGSRGMVYTRTCKNGDGLRTFRFTASTVLLQGVALIYRNYLATESPSVAQTATTVSSGNIPYPDLTAPAQPHYCLATGHGQDPGGAIAPGVPSGTNPTYSLVGYSTSGSSKLSVHHGTSTSTSALGARSASGSGWTNFYHGMVCSWLLL